MSDRMNFAVVAAVVFVLLVLLWMTPAQALTPSQVAEASDLIAKIDSFKSDFTELDKIPAPPRKQPTFTITLSRDEVRRVLQARIEEATKRLNELGVNP